jgi:hypothetical protein
VAFLVLRLLIMVTAGLAMATLIRWWGHVLRTAAKATPAGWVDRPAGFLVGAGAGVLMATCALLVALLIPWPREVSDAASQCRAARPMMARAARACTFGARIFPGSLWLRQRFLAAERRAERRARPS